MQPGLPGPPPRCYVKSGSFFHFVARLLSGLSLTDRWFLLFVAPLCSAQLKVDGMDVLNVRACTDFAVQHCRAGNGPFVLEMDTYRYHGHSMSDPGITYRNRDEVAGVRAARDPVQRIKKYLLELEFATEADIKAIDADVKKEVNAAVEAAKAAPIPPMSDLYTDIYTDQSPAFFMRGCDMSVSSGTYGTTK